MKDKINLFFKYKFLVILIIFILCSFLLCTSCFAYFSFNVGSNVYNLPDIVVDDERPLYVIYYRSSLWLLSSEPVYCLTMYKNVKDVCFDFSSNNNVFSVLKNDYGIKTYYCKVSNPDSWKLAYTDSNKNDSYSYSSLNDILYSTNSIYRYGTDEVVFPAAPQKVEQVTIPKIQQVEEIPQAMEEVMKILIPVGLIIFGIGLLIYLMRLVIFRMKS